MDLTEAIQMLELNGFDINAATNTEGDELDQIPYYENERFRAWVLKQGVDVYLSNEELCKKKYEEYKKLVRAKRDFE
jgi:hypothetical protein